MKLVSSLHWRYAQKYDHTAIDVLTKCNITTIYRMVTRFEETDSPHTLPRGHRPPELEWDVILYTRSS
jgi:hypothetical protein